MEDKKEKLPSTNINWARRILAKQTSNLYKISISWIGHLAYFDKK